MKIHKKKVLVVLIFLILFTIGINLNKVYSVFSNEKTNNEIKDDLGVPVETAKVKRDKMVKKLSYIGTLYPRETVEVSSHIPAQITEISVKEGDIVAKGQIIARLDDENIKAKLTTIRAKLDTLKFNREYLIKDEEKYRVLAEGGVIPVSNYEKIRHERQMLDMQLKELSATENEIMVNLKDTVVKAPMGGKVRLVNYSVGDLAITGKPLVIIDDMTELIVKVNISESDIENIYIGTFVSLKIPGINKKLEAQVTRIGSSVNPKTRIGEVELGGLEVKEDVVLGTSVETDFIIEEIEEGYTIPLGAVKELSHSSVVYKLEDRYVKEVSIETGLMIDGRIQVLQGIGKDDEVVVKNIDKLYDGAKVYLYKGVVDK